ncbi:MAG: tetratricopeptide repeat protein [Patescibacteria group bacterium]
MKILKQIEKYLLLFLIFVTPLLVIPIFADAFRVSKIIFLTFGVVIILLVKLIRTFISGQLKIISGNFDFPIFLLFAAYLLSAILVTPNKYEAFFIPGNAILILSVSVLYFLLNQAEIQKQSIKSTIFYSSLIFSLTSILSLSGILQKIPQLPLFMKVSTFNTEGALIPAVIFMISVLPIAIKKTIGEKVLSKRIFSAVTSIFIASAVLLSLFNVFSDKNITIILSDFSSSWSISIDSLKQNPLLGIGPGNYQTAFNLFRPISYNATDNWSIKLTSARNFYLTVLTETGLLGLSAAILLILVSFRVIKKNINKKSDITVSLGLLLILLAFFPSSVTLIVYLIVLLSLNSEKTDFDVNLTLKGQEGQKGSYLLTRIPSILITLPIFIGLIIFSIQGVKTVYAEITFKKAVDSLVKQDAQATYDYIRKAAMLNPYIDRYRSSFSQVSFAIANSIARQENLTEQDKETIAQLIQQAIAEGKAAVTLNPTRSENWNSLANIYQAIIPFAQGADQFAIETYSQAVALDPINPLTRISLGGVYYSLGRYDEAIRVFELAVIAKPDYANAHYNLAVALRDKGDVQNALIQMELVLSLVDKDTPDYELARKEIEALEAKQPAPELEATENLVPPQEAQEPIIKPPLKLPEEANPPSTESADTQSPASPLP